jgi:hypothetical protein
MSWVSAYTDDFECSKEGRVLVFTNSVRKKIYFLGGPLSINSVSQGTGVNVLD